MKFLLCALFLAAVQAACLRQAPRDQKHLQSGPQTLIWLQAYLDSTVEEEACGNTCDCPYKCTCHEAALDDFDDVDDMDVWELKSEEPHECCGCVCGCYNKAAADKIKKLEAQKKVAEKVAKEEKIAADRVALEKKKRAEEHIHKADVIAADRIAKANAAKEAAIAKADKEIAAAHKAAEAQRAKEEVEIVKADEVSAHDKWVANEEMKDTKDSIDAKIAEAEKVAAAKKSAEKAAFDEKKRLEGIALNKANSAEDEVKAAETALEAAKKKHARSVEESAAAQKEADCFKTCITEENCETCGKDKK